MSEAEINQNNNQQEELNRVYEIYRSYVVHEDDLISQRTNWLITVQSFLIATFGFSYQKKFEVFSKFKECKNIDNNEIALLIPMHSEYTYFLIMLAIVGVLICVACFWSIKQAHLALEGLELSYNTTYKNKITHLPHIMGGGNQKVKKSSLGFALLAPGLFGFLWILTIVFLLLDLGNSSLHIALQ